MNSDLSFFCRDCQCRSDEQSAHCSIEHQLRRFSKGEMIVSQGEEVSHLLFLSQGVVRTEMVSGTGEVMPIEELAAPYPLAAGFLFADNNRFPVDVIAKEYCELRIFRKDTIEQQMMKCVCFLRGFMAFNANRMCFLSERLRIFALKGIKAKFAYYVMQREKNGYFELGRSMADLAGYFSVERPSLSRAVAEMVRDGIITFEGGKGQLVDYKEFRKLF